MQTQAPTPSDPHDREPDDDEYRDDIPDVPPTEPPPEAIRDPQPEGTPPGPYISQPR